jgi:hypothetical protein
MFDHTIALLEGALFGIQNLPPTLRQKGAERIAEHAHAVAVLKAAGEIKDKKALLNALEMLTRCAVEPEIAYFPEIKQIEALIEALPEKP